MFELRSQAPFINSSHNYFRAQHHNCLLVETVQNCVLLSPFARFIASRVLGEREWCVMQPGGDYDGRLFAPHSEQV